ncbi:la-related protein 6-like [Macrobrachium nipponense]|uniref:la-related protein 6-like n=1 Tax=Macrobrachium nipponense TaxID=159736 RepID=UPI0030C8C444
MLSLLSRIVIGDSEERSAKEESHAFLSSPGSSASGETDEEYVSGDQMPIINIDRTELAQEAISADKDDFLTSSDQTDSSEDNKDDSALDEKADVLPPLIIPSRDVCRRILELVEYYLSDANLVKDMFLLKHVTKHREGFVSLKLVTSYKKVKRLTKDWRAVAHSLRASKTLEMNSDETKVRRKDPLAPELEEDTRPFRTMLATHISPDCCNMNQLAEFFGKFGDMISLQVHKPGGRTLNEVRLAEREHPGIAQTICALVEYEKVHSARQSLRYINNNANECKMKIMEVPRKKPENLLCVKGKADPESAYYSNSELSEPPSPVYHGRTILKKLKTPSSSVASSPCVSPITKRRNAKVISSPESSPPSPYHSRYGHPSPSSSPDDYNSRIFSPESFHSYRHYDTPGSLPLPRRKLPRSTMDSKTDSPHISGRSSQNSNYDSNLMPLSPWLRRRALAKRNEGASPSSTPSSSPSLRRRMESPSFLPDNVMRFPKGPDGTKGFTLKRSVFAAAKA